jgi:hypothetical protein
VWSCKVLVDNTQAALSYLLQEGALFCLHPSISEFRAFLAPCLPPASSRWNVDMSAPTRGMTRDASADAGIWSLCLAHVLHYSGLNTHTHTFVYTVGL